ncbi:two-component system sensor histidine kinase NtrB [Sulfoacidibacillus thermotolerans]|uniref:histidine kinase n=1 Tax=Sulfoacidibacillus thermotolerans TaxID=1765684 RepID=A0A2U3D6C4_SULT2|nr:ATP-binding protein [Sulfoacidibacillus thermotolerans]PWI56827.1 hypothetical protein BM613_11785 [Sulfoacidibacillus thermotolerans]
MRLNHSTIGIAAVIILSASLLIGLIYNDYKNGCKIIERAYNVSLEESGQLLVNEISKSYLHREHFDRGTLQTMLQHQLRRLSAPPLQVEQIGLIDYPAKTMIAKVTVPAFTSDRSLDNPISLAPRLKNGHIMSTSFPNMDQHTFEVELAFPVIQNHVLVGVVYFIASEMTIEQTLKSMFYHQLLIGLLIALLALLVTQFIYRFIHTVNTEPTELVGWINRLVEDPFVTPPSTLHLLNPLTQTILKMRKKLYQQEDLIHQVIKHAPLAIISISHTGAIEIINDTFLAITGFSEGDVLGKPILKIVSRLEISRQSIQDVIQKIHSGANIRSLEISFIHTITREPKVVECSIVANALTTQNTTGIIVFAEDLTTRKQWEAFTAKIDRLNLIAELAASTAHEIRNPLTTVRGFLQLQRRRNQDLNGKDHYHIMIEEIDRVDDLISEYLTLARNSVQSGREPVEIRSVIEDLLPLITAEANMKGVIMLVPDLPSGFCLANKSELKQVFLNLGKNALDAMPNGGTLSIFGKIEQNFYILIISDTGIGISQAHLQKIFDPFFTTKSTGSGLGLAISKKIIEAHHGLIQVESEINRGTRFSIELPLYRSDDL